MDDARSESDRNSDARSMCRSLKLKRLLVAEGDGLSMAEGIFLRNSRYADGGVMGVFRSSFLKRPGEGAIGLNVSDGNVPDPGVCSWDADLAGRLSKPAAAMVAVEVAEAMSARRRLRKRGTEESNE